MIKLRFLTVVVLLFLIVGFIVACFPGDNSEIPRRWYATGVPTPEPMQISSRVETIYTTCRNVTDMGTSFVITEDGQLWIMGGVFLDSDFRPRRMGGFGDVIAISDRGGHRMIITSDGTLWGRGSNDSGQVGIGREGRPHTVMRETEIMEDVIAVSIGSNYTMAITSDNVLWGWGGNTWGSLGDGTTEDRHSPVKIMENVIAVYAGFNHTMALTSDNTLWGWGRRMAVSDDGTSIDSHIPVQLMNDVIAISAAGFSSMAITSDNTLWDLRLNGYTIIMEDVIAVSSNTNHAMAITSDGSLWAWGRNYVGGWAGMLGDGTFRDRTEPVKIMEDVVSVSAGGSHTLAITSDGNLWAWGDNSNNQLGIGTDRGEYESTRLMDANVIPRAWLSPVLVMEYVPEG